MKTSTLFHTTILSLGTFVLLGCGGGKSTNMTPLSPLGTTENSRLILKIDNEPIVLETNNTNFAPTAVATANGKKGYVNVATGEIVSFDSNASEDKDGNIISYLWTDMDYNILSTDSNFTRIFYQSGIYEKTLSVVDDKGNISNDRVCILVDIDKEDIEMIANAGADIKTYPDTNVTLDARVVCKDGNYTYEWSENGEILSTEKRFTKTYDEGTHDILVKITDNDNNHAAWDTVSVTVLPLEEEL